MQTPPEGGLHYARELLAVLQESLADLPADFVLLAMDALRMVLYCAPTYHEGFKPRTTILGLPTPTLYNDGSIVLAALHPRVEILDYATLTDDIKELIPRAMFWTQNTDFDVETRYQAFVSQRSINTANESIQAAQLALIQYGAANMCITAITDEGIDFNSPCLRLLRALFDGAPGAVERKFEEQLNYTPNEVFVTSYKLIMQEAMPSVAALFKSVKHGTYLRTLQSTRVWANAIPHRSSRNF
jgi:hypothetical protein